MEKSVKEDQDNTIDKKNELDDMIADINSTLTQGLTYWRTNFLYSSAILAGTIGSCCGGESNHYI
jgi:hypothetical protein